VGGNQADAYLRQAAGARVCTVAAEHEGRIDALEPIYPEELPSPAS
jgi:hypothetical protein